MANDEKVRTSGEVLRAEASVPVVPAANLPEKVEPKAAALHPAVYVATWISLSSSVIIFNKYILDRAGFKFPIVLTTWHLVFATIMTQLMARFTHMLDSRHSVPMTGRVYLRAIVPIGFCFSLSLICGNLTYLYLSVSFIQMLKATMPVAVLLTSWAMGVSPPSMKTLGNVSLIVVGVIIASVGEVNFVLVGVLWQAGGILFEAIRLTMIQRLLSSAEFKMDPLVSLYYFAPVCAAMNFVLALVIEVPRLTMADIYHVGVFVLIANALVAFALNVSVVFLIGKTSSLVLTLCGVLKDILLVLFSLVIFGDPVSGLQAFGYSIALGGLIYYKLGADKLREYLNGGLQSWAEYRANRPVLSKLLVLGIFVFAVFLVMGGLFPYVPDHVQQRIYSSVGSE